MYLLNHAISQRRAFAPALTLRRAILDLTLRGTTLASEKVGLSATAGDVEGAGALGAEELLGVIGIGEHLYTIDIIF